MAKNHENHEKSRKKCQKVAKLAKTVKIAVEMRHFCQFWWSFLARSKPLLTPLASTPIPGRLKSLFLPLFRVFPKSLFGTTKTTVWLKHPTESRDKTTVFRGFPVS